MIRLYDSRTQQIVPLEFRDNTVRMYVCGITPYDASHLGHARVAVVYDTLRRFLEWLGLRVYRYSSTINDSTDPHAQVIPSRLAGDGIGGTRKGRLAKPFPHRRHWAERVGQVNELL